MRSWHGRRRWLAFAFVVLFFWAAYWPVSRLEVSLPDNKGGRFYSIPSNGRFQVLYGTAGKQGIEVRSFRVEGDGSLRLVETAIEPAPGGWQRHYDPADVSRRGGALVVKGTSPPFPALHVVIQAEDQRVLRLEAGRDIDLSALFSNNAIITIRVVKKPVLFFLWKRYWD